MTTALAPTGFSPDSGNSYVTVSWADFHGDGFTTNHHRSGLR